MVIHGRLLLGFTSIRECDGTFIFRRLLENKHFRQKLVSSHQSTQSVSDTCTERCREPHLRDDSLEIGIERCHRQIPKKYSSGAIVGEA